MGSVLKRKKGLGISIPPLKQHVLIYFSQQGQTDEMAASFFGTYEKAHWKNRKGLLIKNWKIHAWQWIWERDSSG